MSNRKQSNICIKEIQYEKCLNCNKFIIPSQLKDHQASCAVTLSAKDQENLDKQLALFIQENTFESKIFGYPNQTNQKEQLKPKIQLENVLDQIKQDTQLAKPISQQNQDPQGSQQEKSVLNNQSQSQLYEIKEQFQLQQQYQQDHLQRDDLNTSTKNQIKIEEYQIEPQQFQNKLIIQDGINNQNLYQNKKIPLENQLQVNPNIQIQEERKLENDFRVVGMIIYPKVDLAQQTQVKIQQQQQQQQQPLLQNNQKLLNESQNVRQKKIPYQYEAQEQQFQDLQKEQLIQQQQKKRDIKIYIEVQKNGDQNQQSNKINLLWKKKVEKESSLNEKKIIENQLKNNQQNLQTNENKSTELQKSLQLQQKKQQQAQNKQIKINLMESIPIRKNQERQQILYQPGIMITDQQVNQMSPEEIYEYFTQLDQENQVGLQSKINLLDNKRVQVNVTDNCPICMDDIQPQKEAVDIRLDCNHLFHYDCIKQWLLKQKFCPICKDRIYFINYSNFK